MNRPVRFNPLRSSRQIQGEEEDEHTPTLLPPRLQAGRMPLRNHLPLLLKRARADRQLPRRGFSKSTTSLPRKPDRVRDHSFDDYMDVQKKVRRTLRLQKLILSSPSQCLPVSLLDSLACRTLSLRPNEAGAFLLKHPHVFHVFDHPIHRLLFCRLTPRALRQIHDESAAVLSLLPDTVLRLRKLLMLSRTGRLRLEHLRVARRDLALPDDFDRSVVLAHPEYFRLVEDDAGAKFVEIVHARDSPELAVCAIERAREREYRDRGGDAEDVRFAFLINFPPGFKIGKYFRVAMWKWQRVPYWSPYEDVSEYDMRSLEARKRMEKRSVAVIHELLSLMVEKRSTMERIAHFREEMDLPRKLKEFLLMYQGIFYVSTRGNQGKLHTVFLREAYKKGELVEPNAVYLARRKLEELLLLNPKLVNLDRALTSLGRGWEVGNGRGEAGGRAGGNVEVGEEEDDASTDSGVESEYLE